MSDGKRVVVFVASLRSGGAERVAVRLCGWLRDAGHEVCLLTLSSADSDFYPCPEGVRRVGLGLQAPSSGLFKALAANVMRWRAVRRAVTLHSAEVVVSLGDRSNVLMLMSTIGLSCRRIISERTDPMAQSLPRGWKVLRRLTYPLATLHVSQSLYVSAWIHRLFPSLPCRVIGNAGETGSPETGARPVVHRRGFVEFVAIGRLSREKGIDLLLTALASAQRRTSISLRLTVAGDGEERMALANQAEALSLGDGVRFSGRVKDVQRVLRDADVYVLPSRLEGFPNAMIEAMVLGLPVIAARCRGGVEDLLKTDGDPCALDFPPGDVATLADHIVRLAEDADLRLRLGSRARERSADYSEERIAGAWREVVLVT